jgi:nicotinamide-nucleotide amidase
MARSFGPDPGETAMPSHSAVELVHRILSEKQLTLAVAESLTAGNIQARISAVSGASRFFVGGVTAYTIPIKTRLLGVDQSMAEKCNAVSSQVAIEMAMGASQLFSASFAVATTGYAEPSPSIAEPFAHVAVVGGHNCRVLFDGIHRGPGLGREAMQHATAAFAIDALASVLTRPDVFDGW